MTKSISVLTQYHLRRARNSGNILPKNISIWTFVALLRTFIESTAKFNTCNSACFSYILHLGRYPDISLTAHRVYSDWEVPVNSKRKALGNFKNLICVLLLALVPCIICSRPTPPNQIHPSLLIMILLVKNDTGWFDKLRHHNRHLKNKFIFFTKKLIFILQKEVFLLLVTNDVPW